MEKLTRLYILLWILAIVLVGAVAISANAEASFSKTERVREDGRPADICQWTYTVNDKQCVRTHKMSLGTCTQDFAMHSSSREYPDGTRSHEKIEFVGVANATESIQEYRDDRSKKFREKVETKQRELAINRGNEKAIREEIRRLQLLLNNK